MCCDNRDSQVAVGHDVRFPYSLEMSTRSRTLSDESSMTWLIPLWFEDNICIPWRMSLAQIGRSMIRYWSLFTVHALCLGLHRFISRKMIAMIFLSCPCHSDLLQKHVWSTIFLGKLQETSRNTSICISPVDIGTSTGQVNCPACRRPFDLHREVTGSVLPTLPSFWSPGMTMFQAFRSTELPARWNQWNT